MPKVLIEKKRSVRRSPQKRSLFWDFTRDFQSGKTKISLVTFVSLVFFIMLSSGFFYLYQVNDLATKGFEIKEIENKIESLEEQRKKLRIKETELKSMYNLEKEVESMNLTNCSEISYIEEESPLAMK